MLVNSRPNYTKLAIIIRQLPSLGDRVHYLMRLRGFSPYSLSKALGDKGYDVSPRRLFYLCLGKKDLRVSVQELIAYKDFFGIEYRDLLGEPDPVAGEARFPIVSIPPTIGKRIELIRELNGIPRVLFAEQLNMSYYRLFKIETGQHDLWVSEYPVVRSGLNVTFNLLIEGAAF